MGNTPEIAHGTCFTVVPDTAFPSRKELQGPKAVPPESDRENPSARLVAYGHFCQWSRRDINVENLWKSYAGRRTDFCT
jgi:hypothetical protein